MTAYLCAGARGAKLRLDPGFLSFPASLSRLGGRTQRRFGCSVFLGIACAEAESTDMFPCRRPCSRVIAVWPALSFFSLPSPVLPVSTYVWKRGFYAPGWIWVSRPSGVLPFSRSCHFVGLGMVTMVEVYPRPFLASPRRSGSASRAVAFPFLSASSDSFGSSCASRGGVGWRRRRRSEAGGTSRGGRQRGSRLLEPMQGCLTLVGGRTLPKYRQTSRSRQQLPLRDPLAHPPLLVPPAGQAERERERKGGYTSPTFYYFPPARFHPGRTHTQTGLRSGMTPYTAPTPISLPVLDCT
ncbi:hypothetical protein C8R45DRAFT_185592 [Mycena sanguinolenta]|nr:hypothetical protein C8R45DRAFT_185592 [Mycena sanguinolenta]